MVYLCAGLLEGAAAGVGLGHEFLRHCQRTRALVHVIDGTSPDPTGDYAAIRTELALFNPDLLTKPQARCALLARTLGGSMNRTGYATWLSSLWGFLGISIPCAPWRHQVRVTPPGRGWP